jgi:hypothetical protein
LEKIRLSARKKCFEGSPEHDENSKEALRYLSMVMR